MGMPWSGVGVALALSKSCGRLPRRARLSSCVHVRFAIVWGTALKGVVVAMSDLELHDVSTTRSRAIAGCALVLLLAHPLTAGAQERLARHPFAGLFEAPAPAAPEMLFDAGTALALQQPAAPAPVPRRTGFKALVFETGADFKAFPRRRSTWVILGVGGAAAALAYPADDNLNGRLAGSDTVRRIFVPGKYIGAAPVLIGTAAGLYLVGRYILPPAAGEPQTNKVSHLGFDLLRAVVVSQALTQAVKVTVRRDRPTGECCAFPSGHASAAFAAAAVLERHLGYRAAWPTLAIAAYVGASRLHDNRHFLSDVIFGSALGMATGWTVVGRHGRSEYALVPAPTRGGVAVSLVRRDRGPTASVWLSR
jgi:membrane-associated phospholipid phosphatase